MAAPRADIDLEEMARLESDDWTRLELAAHFKVHPATIDRRRKELGIIKRRPMDPERKAKIEAMLDDGWSFAEIYRTEGAHPETLRKHFPGRAWTDNQRGEYQAALRLENPHYFNYRPKSLRNAA
jgi:hypothetical protein